MTLSPHASIPMSRETRLTVKMREVAAMPRFTRWERRQLGIATRQQYGTYMIARAEHFRQLAGQPKTINRGGPQDGRRIKWQGK